MPCSITNMVLQKNISLVAMVGHQAAHKREEYTGSLLF